MSKKQLFRFFVFVILCVAAAAAAAQSRINRIEKINYSEHLDEVIVKIDESPFTLRDFGVYAVLEEKLVEEQALVYDDTDTKKYWNSHTNGKFLKILARDTAIDMMIHDAVFYRMAMEEEITLDHEEKRYLANEQADFWDDLEEEQREKLSLSQDEINGYLEKMALAQKMQRQQAYVNKKEVSAYDAEGEEYEKILTAHTVWKNEELIDRIDFGNIILEHERR